jgi:hypothetical protein
MVRGKGTVVETKETLSFTEKEGLLDEKKELQATLSEIQANPGSSKAGMIDTSTLRAKINRIDHAINIREVEQVRGKSKDSLYREEREIEDHLAQGMPTRYEMDHPARCPGAVRKHMAWDARNKQAIQRYVEIQRILRPEEPKSIEELRKEGGPQDRGR